MPKLLLGKLDEVPPGKSKTFVTHGKKILIANVGGVIKAYENFCPHMGGAMRYDGKRVVCSWHGAQFNPLTGESVAGITEGSVLKPMTVSVEGDGIWFDTDDIPRSPWADDFS